MKNILAFEEFNPLEDIPKSYLDLIINKSNNHKQAYKFIKNIVKDLKIVKLKKWPNWLFWFDSANKCIFQKEKTNHNLYVRFSLWSKIEKDFSLNYYDVQALIKYIVEEEFKNTPITPANHLAKYYLAKSLREVEEEFKNTLIASVEEEFKKTPITPSRLLNRSGSQVEEEFKKTITPHSSDGRI